MFTTADEVLRFVSDEQVRFIDIQFCDLPGTMQHFTVPAAALHAAAFEDGLPFDGSSVRGFQAIHESDMLLVPDPASARIDPFRARKTLAMNCFVRDPLTREPYRRDPRTIARKAERYVTESGIADRAYVGPEPEFFIFDSVRFDYRENAAFHEVDSVEGWWNTGADGGNQGYKMPYKAGYFPVPPRDHFSDLRDEIVLNLASVGIEAEKAHHEVGSGGQNEVSYRYNTLLRAADELQLVKYVVKNTAWAAGKTATFMPKPLFDDNGSGMHCNLSLWDGDEPLFYEEDSYGGLSEIGRHYIGGILHHAPSLLAFHRLVPRFEAPVNLAYAERNRSACVRIPFTGTDPRAKRIEFRCPDASGNPYLAFAAITMAGLDGVVNKIEPPDPIDQDLYELPPAKARELGQVPASLDAAIDRLEADHEYLRQGGVFTPDVIETWIGLKREEEIDPLRVRPHPYEFALYYDV